SLVTALASAADRLRDGRPLDVLVQVSLDGEEHRGGVVPADLDRVADAVAGAPSRRLRDGHPEAAVISAGMSGDLEAAIAHGATHVRVGSALLGMRARLG